MSAELMRPPTEAEGQWMPDIQERDYDYFYEQSQTVVGYLKGQKIVAIGSIVGYPPVFIYENNNSHAFKHEELVSIDSNNARKIITTQLLQEDQGASDFIDAFDSKTEERDEMFYRRQALQVVLKLREKGIAFVAGTKTGEMVFLTPELAEQFDQAKIIPIDSPKTLLVLLGRLETDNQTADDFLAELEESNSGED